MTQFLRDQISDSEEVVTPFMQDVTYLSRNIATLGPSIQSLLPFLYLFSLNGSKRLQSQDYSYNSIVLTAVIVTSVVVNQWNQNKEQQELEVETAR